MNACGILLIDKPAGMSSFDVIRSLRKITKIRKLGHAGTLDPFASGLLPVCLGKATRTIERLVGEKKEYLVTMKFGVRTETGDPESEVIEQQDPPEKSFREIEDLKSRVIAITAQIPHRYSAIKVNGKRAYELSRRNLEFELKERPIKIYDFEVVSYEHPVLSYRVKVSKGTYIRSLSETIAALLGTIGTTLILQRTMIGEHNLSSAVKLETLQAENWQQHLVPLAQIFSNLPSVSLAEIEYFKNGRQIAVEQAEAEDVAVLSETGELLGFGEIKANLLQPRLVLI